MDDNQNTATMIIIIVLYFLPVIIAEMRKRVSTGAIFITNLAFGWTFIGWFVCLIWAMTYAPKPKKS